MSLSFSRKSRRTVSVLIAAAFLIGFVCISFSAASESGGGSVQLNSMSCTTITTTYTTTYTFSSTSFLSTYTLTGTTISISGTYTLSGTTVTSTNCGQATTQTITGTTFSGTTFTISGTTITVSYSQSGTTITVTITSTYTSTSSSSLIPTSSELTCSPSRVRLGSSTFCMDIVKAEKPGRLAGTVAFLASGSGKFTSQSCTNIRRGLECSVMFTPGSKGVYEIGAYYSGDRTHYGSSALFKFRVKSPRRRLVDTVR